MLFTFESALTIRNNRMRKPQKHYINRGLVLYKTKNNVSVLKHKIDTFSEKEYNGIFLKHSFVLPNSIDISHYLTESDEYLKKYFGYSLRDLEITRKVVINYDLSKDTKLKKHVDDSLITMSICLNNTSETSKVIFDGKAKLIGVSYQNDGGSTEVSPFCGQVLIHYGSHPHETVTLRDGSRTNIIIWFSKK